MPRRYAPPLSVENEHEYSSAQLPDEDPMNGKRFVAYFYCNGADLSLGISICFTKPNIEIHLPFGFIRIGWCDFPVMEQVRHPYRFLYRTWGWQ